MLQGEDRVWQDIVLQDWLRENEAAMEIMSNGVEECMKTCINIVPYTGVAGATTLTGTMTIQF